MDSTHAYPRLVGDIGGTHARLATVATRGAPPSDISVHACADFDGIEALLRHRLTRPQSAAPRACALGIATPVNRVLHTLVKLLETKADTATA